MIKLDEDNKNKEKAQYFRIKNDNPDNNYTPIERFMERKGLSIRQRTGIGRKFYSNTYHLVSKYINNIHNYYLNYGQDLSLVWKMDETPLFFSMPSNKTVEMKRKKNCAYSNSKSEKIES